MDLEQVKEFMKQAAWGTLATTDGRRVGVRPMGGWAWKQNQLWCATDAASDKIAQLKKVPHAEYCFCDAAGKHLRIAGPCTISTDNDEKLWLYKAVPALKDHIPDPAAPHYVVIKMTPDNIRSMESTDLKYTRVKLNSL
ncbi:MAG: pyridoxamine 5'-phosphate oxidase family protein [Planctomycetota bacterium]